MDGNTGKKLVKINHTIQKSGKNIQHFFADMSKSLIPRWIDIVNEQGLGPKSLK